MHYKILDIPYNLYAFIMMCSAGICTYILLAVLYLGLFKVLSFMEIINLSIILPKYSSTNKRSVHHNNVPLLVQLSNESSRLSIFFIRKIIIPGIRTRIICKRVRHFIQPHWMYSESYWRYLVFYLSITQTPPLQLPHNFNL